MNNYFSGYATNLFGFTVCFLLKYMILLLDLLETEFLKIFNMFHTMAVTN